MARGYRSCSRRTATTRALRFVYALAPVMDIFGAHKMAVRAFAAVLGLATVLLIGVIAYRRFRSVTLLVCTLVMAGLTPWHFQSSGVPTTPRCSHSPRRSSSSRSSGGRTNRNGESQARSRWAALWRS